jgi:hypothetical protein
MYYQQLSKKMFDTNIYVHDVIPILSRRFQQYFDHPIYVIGLFLTPQYRAFAISKYYSYQDVQREIIQLAINWNFSKEECREIAKDLNSYRVIPFKNTPTELSALLFWQSNAQFGLPIMRLCRWVFEVKGYAAPVETLFSNLSYAKTKIRNKMTTNNMKIMGIVRKSLQENNPLNWC